MFGTLKNAYDLAKDLTTLQVSTEFKTKITELLAQLMTAREEAAALQDQNFSLLAEVRDLKAQAAKREDWRAEKETYERRRLGDSAVAYILKPTHRPGQDPHALCAQCFDDGKKGYLQPVGTPGAYHTVEHRCSLCGSRTAFEKFAIHDAWQSASGA
jgi:hypothetical protein